MNFAEGLAWLLKQAEHHETIARDLRRMHANLQVSSVAPKLKLSVPMTTSDASLPDGFSVSEAIRRYIVAHGPSTPAELLHGLDWPNVRSKARDRHGLVKSTLRHMRSGNHLRNVGGSKWDIHRDDNQGDTA